MQSAFATSAASGAVGTYEATLRAISLKVTRKLGTKVLPMLSASQFPSFLCSFQLSRLPDGVTPGW